MEGGREEGGKTKPKQEMVSRPPETVPQLDPLTVVDESEGEAFLWQSAVKVK